MITIKLEEREAKELLTFLLNQQKWLEEASKREGIDNLKKARYDNTIKIIKPVIEELERAFRESFEPQKSDTEIVRLKGLFIVCKKCNHRAFLSGYTIADKERILKFWTCPSLHPSQYYEVYEGGVE
jgi:CRISPR/Cas system-associated protein Cas7 (RAMP superfamily)